MKFMLIAWLTAGSLFLILKVLGTGTELEENIFGQTVFSCEKDTPFGESNHEVVAWMPVIVPEPYKEK